ncbi:uncharacterized protein MKK02DRAFT_30686 [Dioszegia hungarica]|uniref:Uncharacterized protein n=1 Tax=Dioszegia hungarica TaxID=4972 RepID=A0AA38H1V6_9TREE|nr:uncharacterized protein MKK02DRAFT_30686 [Dioszegia hungarica]KAI9632152.1 hypothetical protein MKK02DRAFT_30686 [Dioszegia hungarica]
MVMRGCPETLDDFEAYDRSRLGSQLQEDLFDAAYNTARNALGTPFRGVSGFDVTQKWRDEYGDHDQAVTDRRLSEYRNRRYELPPETVGEMFPTATSSPQSIATVESDSSETHDWPVSSNHPTHDYSEVPERPSEGSASVDDGSESDDGDRPPYPHDRDSYWDDDYIPTPHPILSRRAPSRRARRRQTMYRHEDDYDPPFQRSSRRGPRRSRHESRPSTRRSRSGRYSRR